MNRILTDLPAFLRQHAFRVAVVHTLFVHLVYIILYQFLIGNHFWFIDSGLSGPYVLTRNYVYFFAGLVNLVLLIVFSSVWKTSKRQVIALLAFSNFYYILLVLRFIYRLVFWIWYVLSW